MTEATKAVGPEDYLKRLRSPVRALWNGVIDSEQFSDAMISVIQRGLTQAWRQGAAECGTLPEDLTSKELLALDKVISDERLHIADFGNWIEENNKTGGGKLQPIFDRLLLWASRYEDVRNQAKVMACKDQKLIWQLGATEKHCSTCRLLHNKVKRASEWEKLELRPQSPPNDKLECGGWECLCTLKPTDKPVTKGKLPIFNEELATA